MKINRKERNRTFLVFLMFIFWTLVIVFTLVKSQIFNYNKYLSKIKAQSHRIFSLHPKRGTIYDSKGEVLAISIKAKSAFLSNKNHADSLRILHQVKKLISLSSRDSKNITSRIRRGEKFIWIKRKLDHDGYLRLKKTKVNHQYKSVLGFIDEYKRVYPHKTTAAHLLGGVGIDEQGLYGVEYALDSVIRGKGSRVKVLLDARRKIFNFQYLDEPVSGRDVYLSVDYAIQFFVEKELKKTIRTYSAKGGAVLVMNSLDGSILTMASYPSYNPDRIKYIPGYILKNNAISFLYDPGSTFKIVLASSALENKVCYLQQIFNCHNGIYHLGGRDIIDVHPYKNLTFEDIIVKSSNIGAVRVGLRLGKERYFKTIEKFGFGRRTGIRLPAEEKGIVNPLKRWDSFSIASLAFGYEISVTPIQMLRAFNVIASGGYLISPRIIKKIDGIRPTESSRVRIVSPSTQSKMLSIMTEVVNRGTGKKSRVEGINVAGKTGTAKKIRRGKYDKVYVSSFGGFFPAQNPQITIYVVIDEPVGAFYGGDVASPLFKAIVEKLLIYLHIFPEMDQVNEIRI